MEQEKRILSQQRIITIAAVFGLLALVVGINCVSPQAAPPKASPYEKLVIRGDPVLSGMADVSVEYGKDGIGWMSYSRVDFPKVVSTHLAKSTDHGKTWTFVSAVNKSAPGTYTRGLKKLKGIWRYETSTLLFDPGDKPARHWKLYVQRYLSTPPHLKADYSLGWIEVKYAKNPQGPWSEPVRLFGRRADRCHVNLNDLHPDLAKMAFYYELGSIVVDGVIYLSMDASPTSSGIGGWKKRRVILVASKDHGRSWRYVGTLTDYKDAGSFRHFALTASSLVREDGQVYLMLTPAGAKGLFKRVRGHNGTYVIPFKDITQATLKRDAKGKLVAHKLIDAFLTSGGQADYDAQNTAGGIVFSQIHKIARPDPFQSFHSRKRIMPKGKK